MKTVRYLFTAIILAFSACSGNMVYKTLEQGFDNPPAECRPSVWWHWMGGQITLDGIRKDLEWMDRSGIGGIHCFDAGFSNVPQFVEHRRAYMSEGWIEAFDYALDIADSLGMEVTIASSPGWSITGGPWVSEDDAQKKLVWSTVETDGGGLVSLALPEPPSCSGPYQNELQWPNDPDRYRYYRDVCVVAMRAPENTEARIVESKVKSGYIIDYKMPDDCFTPEYEGVCPVGDVVDISSSFRDGVLDWEAPEGKWKIFRFGYSLLGRVNGPTVPEAQGLEADKLDAAAMTRYYSNYLKLYKDAAGERLGGNGIIKNFLIDSYEAGKGTWTPKIEEEFKRRRGYDLRPWMPVLTGEIIGSSAQSEQFLFDWRQTLGELIVENHYDLVNGILKPLGMKRFSEAHEERRAFVGDGMMAKRGADMPMSAFWVRKRAGWYATYPGCEADIRESASVAHIYGQNICGAESFTTNGKRGKWDGYWAYQCHPGLLKRYADAAMAMGLNRFIIHSSVHQPSDDHVPGLSLSIYGQWFNRHDTWAEEARSWTDYLSRSSFMLSQGTNVADIAYLYGEDTNPTAVHYERRVSLPAGYNYDYVNADILANVLKVRGSHLEAKSGARYGAVVIDTAVHKMSINLLRSLDRISAEGVTVCGNRPQRCANLGYDEEFAEIVGRIWSRSNVCTPQQLHSSLLAAGIREDVLTDRDSVAFVHRRVGNAEMYWLANISSSPCRIEASFAVSGLEPELWNAADGSRRKASYSADGDRTKVVLDMERDDALFVVFARKARESQLVLEVPQETGRTPLKCSWTLSFPDGRGAPDFYIADSLADLSLSGNEAVRYYSGSIVYRTHFSVDSLPEHAYLDLGEVANMARISLNGEDLALLWKQPYICRIDGHLKEGANTLEIKVINSWANRLIGDARSKAGDKTYTFTAIDYYASEDPLPQSGLIGPVELVRMTR